MRVLFSVPEPTVQTNPFIPLLGGAMSRVAEVRYFSWRTALIGRYDVFHAHWPELLMRASSEPRRWSKRILFLLLLIRLRLSRVLVVETIHNHAPHEGLGKADRALVRRFGALRHSRIMMNAEVPLGATDALIPHGHYRDWYGPYVDPRDRATPRTALLFGKLRPYKGVGDLVRAVSDESGPADDGWTLRIRGRVESVAVEREIEGAEPSDAVDLDLRYFNDDELVREIRQAQVVVLPYRRLYNSGALILAMSLGRPVIAPRSPAAEEFAAEFGSDWVRLYDAPLSATNLRSVLQTVGDADPAGPDLSAREWDRLAQSHLRAYAQARSVGKPGGRCSQ